MNKLPENIPIELIGFYAKDNIELCKKFTEGHIDVLRQHGFLHFKTHDNYWYDLENSYVIIALFEGEAVGGIRLEHKSPDRLLPYEKVLVSRYPEIEYLADIKRLTNLAEPCSLWNGKKVSGLNLSLYLSRASIAVAPLVGVENVISFNATYTFRIPIDVGCTMIDDIGKEGYFNYPTDQFRAALWLHSTLDTLENAEKESRDRLLSLRENGQQTHLESNKGKELLIKYDLQT